MTTAKFKVLTTVWDRNSEKQVKTVVGEFDNFANAKLFAKAYEIHYSAKTELVYE